MLRFLRKKGKPLVFATVFFFVGSIVISLLVSIAALFIQ